MRVFDLQAGEKSPYALSPGDKVDVYTQVRVSPTVTTRRWEARFICVTYKWIADTREALAYPACRGWCLGRRGQDNPLPTAHQVDAWGGLSYSEGAHTLYDPDSVNYIGLLYESQYEEWSRRISPVSLTDWPAKCDQCGAPAWVGLQIHCSKKCCYERSG